MQLGPLPTLVEQKQRSIGSVLGYNNPRLVSRVPSLPPARNLLKVPQPYSDARGDQVSRSMRMEDLSPNAVPAAEDCIFQTALSSKKEAAVGDSKHTQKARVVMWLTSGRKPVAQGKQAKPQTEAELSRNKMRLQKRG